MRIWWAKAFLSSYMSQKSHQRSARRAAEKSTLGQRKPRRGWSYGAVVVGGLNGPEKGNFFFFSIEKEKAQKSWFQIQRLLLLTFFLQSRHSVPEAVLGTGPSRSAPHSSPLTALNSRPGIQSSLRSPHYKESRGQKRGSLCYVPACGDLEGQG